ncbi:hypothetical protein Tco_0480497 [Tanacetum coccineum]
MVLSEVKIEFKRWETLLCENAICLSGYKDHPNACLVYMLYCLANQRKFNLAYYIAKRMASVIKSDFIMLPYAMLLTRLYRHVLTIHPYPTPNIHILVNHVMVPLTEGRANRIMIDGKRPHPQTPSESSSSPFPTQNQEENDPVEHYTLDPIIYIDQLPPIPKENLQNLSKLKGCLNALVISYPTSKRRSSKGVLKRYGCLLNGVFG